MRENAASEATIQTRDGGAPAGRQKMNLRRAALLAAIGAAGNFLYVLASLVGPVVRGLMPLQLTFLIPPIGLLCYLLSQAVIFAFLFAEGSGRTGSHARATAALAATALALITAVCEVWETGNIIPGCGGPHVHCAFSVPAAVARGAFDVLVMVGWAVFLLAFTEKVHVLRSGGIPILGVLVAIADFVGSILIIIAPGSPITLSSVAGEGISLFDSIAFLVFTVVLYRKWDSRKPIHDIIFGRTLQLDPEQNP